MINAFAKTNQLDWHNTHICMYWDSVVETVAKKKVEDVMPIATGHEKEELEAELEVISNLLHFVQMRVYCNSICDHDCHLYNHSWRNNLA